MELLETIIVFIVIILPFIFPLILFYVTLLVADKVDKQETKEKEERKAPNGFIKQFMDY